MARCSGAAILALSTLMVWSSGLTVEPLVGAFGHVTPKADSGHVTPREAPGEEGPGSAGQRQVVGCGTHVVPAGASLTITSPNFPDNYPNSYTCFWRFEAESADSTLSLSCTDFDVRGSRKCRQDFLRLNDGLSKKKYCGTVTVERTSTTGLLTAYFRTNRRRRATGFTCDVVASGVPPTDPTTPTSTAASTTTVATGSPQGSDCKCGVVNEGARIVGGQETAVHEIPWQVALVSPRDRQPYCGGSIIADRWVLTAAHCVDSSTIDDKVVIGEHTWNIDSETDATQRLNIARVVSHPNYNSRTLNNDIALLELQNAIEFDKENKVAPVCLPPPGESYDNVQAVVSGWGTLQSGGRQPYTLNKVTVPTMSNAQCTSKYGEGEITANMICAGQDQGGKDSCQGDSGGPLVTSGNSANSFMVQIGIVSWGYGCALAKYPGVYTRFNNYLDWVGTYTEGSNTCPPP